MVGLGGGLVTFVTPLVNSVMLPTTREEKLCTPVTTEAAKADPGRVGMLGPGRPEGPAVVIGPEVGRATGPLKDGS